MSDRSDLAAQARRTGKALYEARRAAFNAELEALADALGEAGDAQIDTAEILERAAPLSPAGPPSTAKARTAAAARARGRQIAATGYRW